jgi:hypothetical protein
MLGTITILLLDGMRIYILLMLPVLNAYIQSAQINYTQCYWRLSTVQGVLMR